MISREKLAKETKVLFLSVTVSFYCISADQSIDSIVLQAARDGDVPKIEKLLEKCQNPNIRRKKINAGDEVKQAPIHYAARYGHYDTLVFLMKNGAGEFPNTNLGSYI